MTEHLDAHGLSMWTTDILLHYLPVYLRHLVEVQLAGQHHHIGKVGIEAQGLDIGNIELGGEVYLLPYLGAVGHHRHIGGDDGADASLVCGIHHLPHRGHVAIVDDGVEGEIRLDAMFITCQGNLLQVVDGEGISGVRPHVELSDAEIHSIGTRLYGSHQ